MKKNAEIRIFLLLALVMYAAFAVFNYSTPLMTDDYSYLFSFETGERITSFSDIVPSMAAHTVKMNGRTLAHALVQVFLFIPHAVFELLNPAIFVCTLMLMSKISCKKAASSLFFVLSFASVWVFTPAVGEVVLWLTGSINYLWSVTAGLLYLSIFSHELCSGEPIRRRFAQILTVILGFAAGAWMENESAAVIFMSVLFTVAISAVCRRRPAWYHIASILASVIGYATIYLSPAELANKQGGLDLSALLSGIGRASLVYLEFLPLIAAFVILLILAIRSKTERSSIFTAIIFAAGSLAANYIMIFADYYPERCAFSVCVFLSVAVLTLASSLIGTKYKPVVIVISALLLIAAAYFTVVGSVDIWQSGCAMRSNIDYIIECRDGGIHDVTLPSAYCKTKYSALKFLKYIDFYDTETWPNYRMAMYYGVDFIIGAP